LAQRARTSAAASGKGLLGLPCRLSADREPTSWLCSVGRILGRWWALLARAGSGVGRPDALTS
jgi:hypothetical protein